MTIVPRYNLPQGSNISLFAQKYVVNGQTDAGYELEDQETGSVSILPFLKFVEYHKAAALSVEGSVAMPSSRVELRLQGLKIAEQLSNQQQEFGEFHHAICIAMDALKVHLRRSKSDPNLELSIGIMQKKENRAFIRPIVQGLFGKNVLLGNAKGGFQKQWFLYQGRTLMKYYWIYETLGDDDDAIAGLATLDHLKGNDRPRLLYRLQELMTQAWEELGFDLKGTSVANVHKHLAMLLHEENVLRGRNQLPMLIMPAEKTLSSHRKELLSPSEFLIATKGERHANNKRGRGSTDVRALMIAEMVEMDECKVSLITSAKERGYWHTLNRDFQEALELADEEIRRRLTILVMIDVATRMPLAWIVSDQPKAEATIALLRMATRDKTREKRIYGCDGDPMPALGLGLVRNDNGTGLRNKQVKEMLMATTAANVDVRAYASADKPYVERMFGTAESVLWKLVHGYTGRKPGENPGYDAKKSGVLDIDQLHAIMTRFFIDEYPSMLHMGVGMGRRRPAEVYKALNKERGIFRRLDEDVRRVHLGWKFEVKPNDEGCRILSGLWYSSDELQEQIDDWPGKISVFIDPDNLTYATAVIQGQPDLIRLTLQTTVFADLTATEFLAIMEEFKRENPETTEIYEDRLAKVRRDRFDLLKQIGVERNLPRSYSTQGEARAKAKVLFAASRIVRTYTSVDTVQPGAIMDQQDGPGVFQLGGGDVIEHFSMENSVTQSENLEVGPPKIGKKKDIVSDGNKPKRLGRPQEKGEFS